MNRTNSCFCLRIIFLYVGIVQIPTSMYKTVFTGTDPIRIQSESERTKKNRLLVWYECSYCSGVWDFRTRIVFGWAWLEVWCKNRPYSRVFVFVFALTPFWEKEVLQKISGADGIKPAIFDVSLKEDEGVGCSCIIWGTASARLWQSTTCAESKFRTVWHAGSYLKLMHFDLAVDLAMYSV